MIDIIVNGGIIDDVSVSTGAVNKVNEHSSTIDISGCSALPINKRSHIWSWIIAIACVTFLMVLGCFIYGIKTIRHQSIQIDQMKIILQERETRLLQLEEQLKLQDAQKFIPDEMIVDSVSKKNK